MTEMVPVVSSNIKEIGYEDKFEVLKVTFNTGKTYDYHGVPSLTFKAFKEAESKGKFFHKNIRPKYAGKRVV